MMKHLRYSSSLLIVLSTTHAIASAQLETRGPMAAYAAGISLSEVGPFDVLRLKDAGDQSGFPYAATAATPFGATQPPDFSHAAMFADDFASIEIDAMSTGNDLLPVDAVTGVINIGNRWGAIAASVTRGASGLPGGWVEARASQQLGPGTGADIISYWIDGSSGIGGQVVGEHFLEQGTEHLGLPPQSELDALDFFIPPIRTSENPDNLLFFATTKFYFSVSSGCVSGLSPTFTSLGPINGATIFLIEWEENNGVWRWSDPTVVLTHQQLGLTSQHDVDALAYNDLGSTVVFSTVIDANLAGPQPEQLLVSNGSWSNATLLVDSTTGVAEKLRIDGLQDDVDALCIFDPEHEELFSSWFGAPVLTPHQDSMHISVTRHWNPTSASYEVVLLISGWGPSGPRSATMEFWAAPYSGAGASFPFGTRTRLPEQFDFEHRVTVLPPPGGTPPQGEGAYVGAVMLGGGPWDTTWGSVIR